MAKIRHRPSGRIARNETAPPGARPKKWPKNDPPNGQELIFLNSERFSGCNGWFYHKNIHAAAPEAVSQILEPYAKEPTEIL